MKQILLSRVEGLGTLEYEKKMDNEIETGFVG